MSKTADEHKELRSQNKANLIGLYIYVGIMLITLVVVIFSTIF